MTPTAPSGVFQAPSLVSRPYESPDTAGSTDSNLELDATADRLALQFLSLAVKNPHKWREAFLRRRAWGYPKATLAETGSLVGVTPERVRQVMMKVDERIPDTDPCLPQALADAVTEVGWDNPGDVQVLLAEIGLVASDRQWSPAGLLDLLRCCGHGSWADAAQARMDEGAAKVGATKNEKRAIRRARSDSGVLDMRLVELVGVRIPVTEVAKLLPFVYRYHVVVGEWALCGGKDGTAVENAAAVQLDVAGELGASELTEGVFRICRKRGWPAAPADILIALLRAKGTIQGPDDALRLGPTGLARELVGNDAWLVDLLSTAPRHMLPVAEVLRRASEAKLKVASITVHLTYSPVVRREHGMVRLIGSSASPSTVGAMRQAARALKVPSGYRLEAHPQGIVIVLEFGTEHMVSGVVNMRKDLRTVIGEDKRGMRCCPNSQFDGCLSVSKGTLLYGWSPMFHHWMAEHDVKEGDEVRVLLTDTHVECIEPWADGVPAAAPTQPAVSVHSVPNTPVTDDQPPQPVSAAPRKSATGPELVRGTRVLKLSPKYRDLLIPGKTDTLGQRFGSPARVLAAVWLRKRPSGGRVWVDDVGRATTLIDDELTYLGSIPTNWRW